MQGISPKLPLEKDEIDGVYSLNKTLKESVKQNFKNLLLTSPGERVMEPTFGVGLRHYLFEPMTSSVYSKIRSKISAQVERYLPFIKIIDVSFLESDATELGIEGYLSVKVSYNIIPLQQTDVLAINSDLN